MPERVRQSGPSKRLKQDRLVDDLTSESGEVTPTIQLTGWLGRGKREGAWHLYLTPQLDEYVEFSQNDVVRTEAVPEDQPGRGATMVWLRAGTVLQHTSVTRNVQAAFLTGEITASFMPGTGFSLPAHVSRFGINTGPACTRNYVCSSNPHVPACYARTEIGCLGSLDALICNSGPFCNTGAFVCGPTAGCTQGAECGVTQRPPCGVK